FPDNAGQQRKRRPRADDPQLVDPGPAFAPVREGIAQGRIVGRTRSPSERSSEPERTLNRLQPVLLPAQPVLRPPRYSPQSGPRGAARRTDTPGVSNTNIAHWDNVEEDDHE